MASCVLYFSCYFYSWSSLKATFYANSFKLLWVQSQRQYNFFTQVSLQVYNMLHAFSRKNTVSKILRTNQYLSPSLFIYLLVFWTLSLIEVFEAKGIAYRRIYMMTLVFCFYYLHPQMVSLAQVQRNIQVPNHHLHQCNQSRDNRKEPDLKVTS